MPPRGPLVPCEVATATIGAHWLDSSSDTEPGHWLGISKIRSTG